MHALASISERLVDGLIGSDILQSPVLLLAIVGAAIAASSALGVIEKTTTRSSQGNLTLEGLRGFLALAVFTHHSYYYYYLGSEGSWKAPQDRFWMQLGQPAVELFFMLTAYLFWSKILENGGEQNWRTYTIRRIFRLLPLYTFSALILFFSAFALSGWTLRTSVPDLVWGGFKWLTLTLFGRPDINGLKDTWQLDAGITWTLRFEALFYAFLPVLTYASTRAKPRLAAITGLIFSLFLWRYAGFSNDVHAWMKLVPFLGGILAAHISLNRRLLLFFQDKRAGLAALLAILLVLFVAPRGYNPFTIAALTFIFVVAVAENRRFAILRSTPISRLGRISYAVYLLHGILLWWAVNALKISVGSKSFYCVFLVICSVTLVFIAWCAHHLVELPGIRAGLRFDKSRAARNLRVIESTGDKTIDIAGQVSVPPSAVVAAKV